MCRPRTLWKRLVLALLLPVLAGPGFEQAAWAAGFELFAQGGKAAGLAGAFVARADDPSAVFYNLGGLALAPTEKRYTLGVTALDLREGLYQGLPPGPGAGTASSQGERMSFLPHLYLVLPVGDDLKVAFALVSPFVLDTRWQDADAFAGRSVATSANLMTYDLMAGVSYPLTPRLGVGLALVYRISELSLDRRFQADDPGGGPGLDVASVAVTSDTSQGLGWSVGALHRINDRLSWGISYRSAIGVDFGAVGTLTQILTGNTQLDQLVAASLPFDQDLASGTSISFPDTLSLGVAVGVGRSLLVEVDAQSTGWSGIDALELRYSLAPLLDQSIALDLDDAMSYRLGVQYTTPTGADYRLGLALEETPQPAATVGPLLADADRILFTAGFGKDPLDIAFVWADTEERVVRNQVDGLNGGYRSSAWTLLLTLTF
ncbi:MAG: outer membrane protein transport protein [Acidobacteria bacterium]|nr:outer membrane protein transport protein [Acidobacteriota bacterium]